MRPRNEENDVNSPADNENWDEEGEEMNLSHKKLIRKRLEEKLERRRLKRELEDFDDEFDYWDEK